MHARDTQFQNSGRGEALLRLVDTWKGMGGGEELQAAGPICFVLCWNHIIALSFLIL